VNDQCRSYQSLLPDLLGDVVMDEQHTRARLHLDTCPACRAYFASLEADDRMLGAYVDRMYPTITRLQNEVMVAITGRSTVESPWLFLPRAMLPTKPIVKTARIAAVVAFVGIGLVGLAFLLRPLLGPSPACGMDRVPYQLRRADTIHVQGWLIVRAPGGARDHKFAINDWIDLKTQRFRTGQVHMTRNQAGEFIPVPSEFVFDGRHTMEMVHGDVRQVQFEVSTPFQAKLALRQTLEHLLDWAQIGEQKLTGYTRTGHERIGGDDCDIWTNEYSALGHKTMCWVASGSGNIKRWQWWAKADETVPSWRLMSTFDVETNGTPPAGVFDMNPPEGMRLLNSQAGARERLGLEHRRFTLEDVEVQVATLFTLTDGSVIMAWRSSAQGREDPAASLFENLPAGAEVPKLPGRIVGLKVLVGSDFLDEADVSWTGRHLAVTRQAGTPYEWSLYVPTRDFPCPGGTRSYAPLVERYPDGWQSEDTRRSDWLLNSFTLGADEFEAFVLGAMAELNDGQAAPGYVTGAFVRQLVDQIRASRKPGSPQP